MNASRFAVRTAATCAALALGLARVPAADATREAPPVAHSGGFGEPTCTACHMQAEANTGPGTVVLEGVPASFTAGQQYTLTVAVRQRGLRGGGYQLTARFEDGTQAGEFLVPEAEATRVGVMVADGVQYAHHLGEGTVPTADDVVTWTLQWIAPRRADGHVLFHAAANATNDDLSPFGDLVYTREAAAQPDSSGITRPD